MDDRSFYYTPTIVRGEGSYFRYIFLKVFYYIYGSFNMFVFTTWLCVLSYLFVGLPAFFYCFLSCFLEYIRCGT